MVITKYIFLLFTFFEKSYNYIHLDGLQSNYINSHVEYINYNNYESQMNNYNNYESQMNNYNNYESQMNNYNNYEDNLSNYINYESQMNNYINYEENLSNYINYESQMNNYINYSDSLHNYTGYSAFLNNYNIIIKNISLKELNKTNNLYLVININLKDKENNYEVLIRNYQTIYKLYIKQIISNIFNINTIHYLIFTYIFVIFTSSISFILYNNILAIISLH